MGRTPLMSAAANGMLVAAEKLLGYHASARLKDHEGWRAED